MSRGGPELLRRAEYWSDGRSAPAGGFGLIFPLRAFALGDCLGYRGLRRFLLRGADGVEALLQRLHQVDDPGWCFDRRRDDLFPGDLGFDDALQPLAVFVLVVGQIEWPLERRDPLLGE